MAILFISIKKHEFFLEYNKFHLSLWHKICVEILGI